MYMDEKYGYFRSKLNKVPVYYTAVLAGHASRFDCGSDCHVPVYCTEIATCMVSKILQNLVHDLHNPNLLPLTHGSNFLLRPSQ